jgi:hypothetical protein
MQFEVRLTLTLSPSPTQESFPELLLAHCPMNPATGYNVEDENDYVRSQSQSFGETMARS